jgi:hypothetical protein
MLQMVKPVYRHKWNNADDDDDSDDDEAQIASAQQRSTKTAPSGSSRFTLAKRAPQESTIMKARSVRVFAFICLNVFFLRRQLV